MIPLAEPNLSGREKEYVTDAIASGWVGPDGPYVERFEEMVAKAAGRKWAVATTTGTMALYAAAKAVNFMGKAVSVPIMAFPAAGNMFRLLGCAVSVHDEFCINHDFQCYIAGNWTGLDRDSVLYDRAPAIGEPLPNGRYAPVECYSFAANKIVTCGHGGAVVGDDETYRWSSRDAISQRYMHRGGNNGRMANLNAAVGCAQMERLGELKETKRYIWDRYAQAGLTMIDRGASRWMSTIAVRDSYEARQALDECDIETRLEYKKDEYDAISIPCSTTLTEDQQDKVIKACESLL